MVAFIIGISIFLLVLGQCMDIKYKICHEVKAYFQGEGLVTNVSKEGMHNFPCVSKLYIAAILKYYLQPINAVVIFKLSYCFYLAV